MAIPMVLVPAILSYLLFLLKSTALIPQIDSQISCNNQHLISELHEVKLKIARLESILEESIQDLNAKSIKLRESEKLIADMNHEIDRLHSVLSSLKIDSSHAEEVLGALEEEVRLLWAASRKNNFEIHALEVKAQDAEKRLDLVTSQAKRMTDIVAEQWIQIQQLEQAVQIAEIRALKFKRQVSSTRCTFVKFIKHIFGNHLQNLKQTLDLYVFDKGSALSSYMYKALQYFEWTLSVAKHYHHQLQGFIKQEMERNQFTAPLANQEVVFFVASALITFPVLSAWMFLSSQFS
ncbi:unnamed protein product [Ilex paraguariensis]|uniref:Tropomyosin n=1 Tax=Ilex paraguariensis TaxID=185542 RepID=A0ABC8ULD5_9AQUA